MNLRWVSHPIPDPKVGLDITQLRISKHRVQVTKTDFGSILVLVLVVQRDRRPSPAQPRPLNQAFLAKLQLRQEGIHLGLVFKKETKFLKVLDLGRQQGLGHDRVQREIHP